MVHSLMVRRNSSCEDLLPPAHIRRGIPVTQLLSNFGSVLLQHPDTLPVHRRARLFTLSEPTTEIEAFISHSWQSPGFHKYLSLLFEEATHWALLAAILAGGLVFCWQMWVTEYYCQWLALPFNYLVTSEFEPFFEVQKLSSPWEYLASACAAMVVFIFFPARFSARRKHFFLDCACIHQTDMRLKTAGIRHLAGFVAMARSMVILWDEQYFSRLWCLYELAVFRKVHPEAPIRIVPLRLSVALLLVQAFTLLGSGLYVALFPLVAPYGLGTFYLLSGACTAVVFCGCAAVGHDLAVCRAVLTRQLGDFDAGSAQCAVPADRAEILASLVEMYGGLPAFNAFVRTGLKRAVLARLPLTEDAGAGAGGTDTDRGAGADAVAGTNTGAGAGRGTSTGTRREGRALLPYWTAVVGIVLPLTGFWLFAMSWYRRAGAATQCCFAVYMTTFWLAGFPLVASWCMTGGSKLAAATPADAAGAADAATPPLSDDQSSSADESSSSKTKTGISSAGSDGSAGRGNPLAERVRAHWRQYLCIGLAGTFWFIGIWTTIAYFGVLAIANCEHGTIMGLRREHSIWAAIAANLPVVMATVNEFRPRSAPASGMLPPPTPPPATKKRRTKAQRQRRRRRQRQVPRQMQRQRR